MNDAPMFAPDSPTTLAEATRCFFRHPSPRFLAVTLGVALTARLLSGGWSIWDGAVVAAIVAFWPIQEWLIHVFLLHFEPKEVLGRTLDFEVPRSHRIHHRDPWNIEILFIPLQGYLIGLPPLLLLAFGLMPTVELAWTVVVVFLALTLRYEWWHFLVHTRVRPRSAQHRRLWRNHRLHHCKSERYWYGVSMLMGDRLLGTSPSPADVETSPTCRTLGIDDTLGDRAG